MAVTLTQVKESAYSLLAEATDSPIGEVSDGAGTLALTQAEAFAAEMQRGAEFLARTCLPIRVQVQAVTAPIARRELALRDYNATYQPTGGTGFTIFAAIDIVKASGRVPEVTEEIISRQDPDYQTAPGFVEYWYPSGASRIGLYNVPFTPTALTVNGLAVPPVLGGLSGGLNNLTPYWQDNDVLYLLPRWTACKLAQTAIDDERLAARIPIWWGEFLSRARDLRAQVPLSLGIRLFPLEEA
jgi:hypothetical protein